MDKSGNDCVALVKKIIWYIIKIVLILFVLFVLTGIIFISLPKFWYLYIIGLIIILFIRLIKRKSIYTTRLYTIEQLDLMQGHQFEYACSNILRENGFKNVKVTKGSGDFGVDIIAEKDNCRYAIQCKRYSSKLDNKPIQEVVAGLAYYGCSKGAVMTNQYFTKQAKVLARINGVQLWDRNVLQGWLRKCNKNPEKENSKDDILLKIECGKTVSDDCSDKLSDKLPDNLVWKAIVEIANSQNASTVFIQRKLMLGRLKADNILNSIEELGLIGPKTEHPTRKVNMRKEDLPYIKTKFSENIITLNKRINDLTEDKAEQAISGTPQSESNEIESTLIRNLEDNIEVYQKYLTSIGRSFASYFDLNNLNVCIEKIVIQFEANTAEFECSLHKRTKTIELKKHLKALAKCAGVEYAKYVFPTATPHTIGIKVPLPDYLKDTSSLIYKYSPKVGQAFNSIK